MGKAVLSKSWQESKLLWHIAFPAILTAVFQFSIGFVTVGFVGHIGSVELAAVTVVENVIEGFAYGVLVIVNLSNSPPYHYARQLINKYTYWLPLIIRRRSDHMHHCIYIVIHDSSVLYMQR